MDRNTRGIVIFAVAYFILFLGLEWYINRAFYPKTLFYTSPVFATAIIVYIAIVATMLLKYRRKKT